MNYNLLKSACKNCDIDFIIDFINDGLNNCKEDHIEISKLFVNIIFESCNELLISTCFWNACTNGHDDIVNRYIG